MRRLLLIATVAVLVSTAGCAGLGGESSDPASDDSTVESDDPAVNATESNQTVQIAANESVAGSQWESVDVTYPRENFTVDSAQHEDILLGVDTNDDGELEQELNETHISGVNNNAYSFTIELDTEYTFETGDQIVVEYPAVDNPAEPGEYTLEVTLNEEQTETGTITITDEESG